MATDDTKTKASGTTQQHGRREKLSPAKQKRLDQCFGHANKQAGQDQFDYATDLFGQCVLGDPSNFEYVKAYWQNLQKKYKNNRKGANLAQLKERGSRSAIKKCLANREWDEVIKHGLKVLAVNPWDVPALTSMSTAAKEMGDLEPELFYLRCALEANPKDPEINVLCAKALGARGQFDQAIHCLHRAEKVLPNDEEIQKLISQLAVEKAITRSKAKDAEAAAAYAGKDVAVGGDGGAAEDEDAPEERLKKAIRANPQEMSHYYELADLYINAENFRAAEQTLAKAYEASGQDADVRERWEDAQMRYLRQQVALAKDDESKNEIKKKLHEKDMEIYINRVKRYPNNLAFKYELGLRYQVNKKYNDAIQQFQLARNDPRRKGLCLLHLGQCFQQIKQYRLAMSHYADSIEEIPDRDADNKKTALYLAGKMAFAMKNLDDAEKHFGALAALDFTYKDVSEMLEKVSAKREEGEEGGEEE